MKNQDWQDSGVMEKQIIAEEGTSEQPSSLPKSSQKQTKMLPHIDFAALLAKLEIFKNRRLQVRLTLLFILVTVFFALLMLAKRSPQGTQKTVVKITIASPAPPPDAELEQAKKEVTVFNNDLTLLDRELNNIKFPQIDLDVKF